MTARSWAGWPASSGIRLRTSGANPFIDPAAWPAFLKGLEDNARQLFGG